MPILSLHFLFFFFFNDTATTEIYTLSLHDALPIFANSRFRVELLTGSTPALHKHTMLANIERGTTHLDRKSTRLNSSHDQISYAVFCLKKKNEYIHHIIYSII